MVELYQSRNPRIERAVKDVKPAVHIKYRALRIIAAIQKAVGYGLMGMGVLFLVTVVARGEESAAITVGLAATGFIFVTCGYVVDLLIDIQASAYAAASN